MSHFMADWTAEQLNRFGGGLPTKPKRRQPSACMIALSFAIGLLFALLFLAAPAEGGASFNLRGPDYSMRISRSPLDPIPLDPDAAGDRPMKWAATQARLGSTFWSYVRDRQAELAWFLIRFDPADDDGDFVWSTGDRLVFTFADSSRVAAEIVTATQCRGFDSLCRLQRLPAALSWDDIATAGGWCAYAGVPRDRIRAHGVLGVSLEVTP